jgi:hypothetical protein
MLQQRTRRDALQQSRQQHVGINNCPHRVQFNGPRSARAAFTSALISSMVMGAMPAAATRSAIDSSELAASRLRWPFCGMASVCDLSRISL